MHLNSNQFIVRENNASVKFTGLLIIVLFLLGLVAGVCIPWLRFEFNIFICLCLLFGAMYVYDVLNRITLEINFENIIGIVRGKTIYTVKKNDVEYLEVKEMVLPTTIGRVTTTKRYTFLRVEAPGLRFYYSFSKKDIPRLQQITSENEYDLRIA